MQLRVVVTDFNGTPVGKQPARKYLKCELLGTPEQVGAWHGVRTHFFTLMLDMRCYEDVMIRRCDR